MRTKVCCFMLCVSLAASVVSASALQWQWSNHAVVTAYNTQVRVWQNGSYVAQMFNLVLDNSASGKSFTATAASDSGFANFVASLKNGINGYLEITMTGVGNGMGANYDWLESEVFSYPIPEAITGIVMKVNTFTLVSPGRNLGQPGQWTDGYYDITFSAMAPEPSPLMLIIIGLLFIAVQRRPPKQCFLC